MCCTQCGRQLEEGSFFCPNCGAATAQAQTAPPETPPTEPVNAAPPVTPLTEPEVPEGKGRMRTVKILLILVIVCFFLPFVLVSCEEMPGTSATATGFELAVGFFSDDYLADEDLPMNVFVALSLVTTAGALVLSFLYGKKKKKLIACLSEISAIALIIFMLSFKKYYFTEEAKEVLTVKFPLGIWVAVILNIAAAELLRYTGRIRARNLKNVLSPEVLGTIKTALTTETDEETDAAEASEPGSPPPQDSAAGAEPSKAQVQTAVQTDGSAPPDTHTSE